MEKFLKNFMKYYEKSRLFRFLYSFLTFVIGVYISSLLSHRYWFIKAMIESFAVGLILYPFFTLKEQRKNNI
ncbi:MAG: hypothetical protein N4A54_02715 [Peptostreptococcaceae bacterium]|jgi:hypothetical protein|nr:hypothetical protein [Peptostreptococcaceae bacterium]